MNRKKIKQEIKTNYLQTNLNKMIMKKVYLILAAAVGMTITSCTTNDYLGDVNNDQAINDGSIKFGFKMQNLTRADIAGQAAATKLGNNFYVTGTKGTEATTHPTDVLVFDNYLVHFDINTAGTTESNTANWEYVGVTPGESPYTNYVKLSSITGAQTIKYWDYSVNQYDFLAFSTGTFNAVKAPDPYVAPTGSNIYVEAMKYGDQITDGATAYTFDLPSVSALENTYISDITEVAKSNFGKEVQLRFKNLGSKVRVALYETIPGYSVRDVKFYRVDGTNTDLGTATKYDDAYLIGANNNSFATKGKIAVTFPHVGTNHQKTPTPGSDPKDDYNIASATVTPAVDTYETFKGFDALTKQLVAKERAELKEDLSGAETGKKFLGRSLPAASFAGDADKQFYQTVFPNTTSYPLTLRVDYTLVPIDGAKETIKVYGAKAVVPSTYTKWQPNYAYTYIFKISDNTNGWTSTAVDTPDGLFPITFDAVVTEATDANAEQTTITTVATPSITTYQQGHNAKTDGSFDVANEYSIGKGKDVYVQVMQDGSLVGTLAASNSLLYKVSDADATEAEVMDALENRTSELATANVTGRNKITLTNLTAPIDNTVTSIENGVDDNPITVTAGQAAKIAITSTGFETGTYAYVYDWTTTLPKGVTTIWQPIAANVDDVIADGAKYVTTAILDGCAGRTAANETVNSDEFLYFSKSNKTTVTDDPLVYSYTYSFVSVDGKGTLPAGLVKCPVGSLLPGDGSTTKVAAGTFVFTTYKRNNGKYAVKVIKIEA